MRTSMCVLVALVGCADLAFADMAATVDPSVEGFSAVSAGQYSIGWRFFVDRTLTITHLGLFDQGDNGLTSQHTMGIWRVNKTGGLTLMCQTGIGPSSPVETSGHHVYVDVPDFTIVPDPVPYDGAYERWIVGVWSPSGSADELTIRPVSAATIAAQLTGFIRIENQLWIESTAFTYPWTNQSHADYFGVNFLYVPGCVVPAPAAVLLGAIGLGHAGWRLRRRGS